MMKTLNLLGRMASKTDTDQCDWDPALDDVIAFGRKKNSLFGIILDETALLINSETVQSFRVRKGNLGFIKPPSISRVKGGLNKCELQDYFLENQDNPYAVNHVINCTLNGGPDKEFTQFPPMFQPKSSLPDYEQRLESLLTKVEIGDLVFSRERNCPISSLIRKEDYCQFSHVGNYVGDNKTGDATLDGIIVSDIMDDTHTQRHYAFYRHRICLTDEQRTKLKSWWEAKANQKTGYNYWGLVKLAIRKRLGISLGRKHPPSVSDLLYSGHFQLIGYV